MSKIGPGYQSHIFQLANLPIGIPANITIKAHAMIRIEGDVQARLGVDFRDTTVIIPTDPRGSIRLMVNGIIVRGSTNGAWRRIDLR